MQSDAFWLAQLAESDAEAGKRLGPESVHGACLGELVCPFFCPDTCNTSRATECACDQEATRRRKRLRGKAVENSLLTPASVRVLSERGGYVPSGAGQTRQDLCASAQLRPEGSDF